MKREITYLLSIPFIAMSFIACSDQSSGSFEKTQASIELQADEPVAVYTGDTLVKNEEDTTIKIRHEATQNTKTVTLLTGSATLLRGDYELSN